MWPFSPAHHHVFVGLNVKRPPLQHLLGVGLSDHQHHLPQLACLKPSLHLVEDRVQILDQSIVSSLPQGQPIVLLGLKGLRWVDAPLVEDTVMNFAREGGGLGVENCVRASDMHTPSNHRTHGIHQHDGDRSALTCSLRSQRTRRLAGRCLSRRWCSG